ncbi:tetratricopeptide repeat protein [uncultured Endozoicomonas sp.]|uniref:tetratricopeptide repeat protein n=1 Tax=uncultured Endozoicomonas sp. TaxID=432652 RepID=UPI00260772AB|nr:tetratricopeptide repeat protein [uncultured Endozoicomonas sp.]
MNRITLGLKKTAMVSVLLAGISAPLAMAAPKKAPELRQITYKYILKAQEQMAEDDYASARQSLEHVLAKVQSSKYDKAAINQMLGVVFANQEQYDKAISYFRSALADDALHLPAAQQVRYNLAQLLMMKGKYPEGIDQLKIWMSNLDDNVEIPARAWIMLANGYSRMQQWGKVIEPAENAIAASDSPPESWYTLLLAAHYEMKDIPSAIDVLEVLVTLAPQKKQYWLQLSGMNMSIKRDAAALAALRAAYRNGLFDKESDYTQLANFLTYQQVPYQAGVVYSKGMQEGLVESNFENLKKLANFWSHARENAKAIDAFNQALELKADPGLQVKLARMLARSERYQELLVMVDNPVEGMTEKQQGEMLFLTGMAHYQLGDTRKSLSYMNKASEYKTSSGQAKSWIGFLQQDLSSQ